MKKVTKTVLVVVSLLLSVNLGFAAEVKKPLTDLTGVAKSSADGVKAESKSSVTDVKENAKGKTADAKAAVKAKLVDINTATETELKAIPGVGDAYAAKIIAGRPYANKTQLKSRKVLPTNIYEQVKDTIIAKQPKK
ncbi:MAG: helix-hairpin-helix domain-containing protein [Geobacteraceae bacterium]|nr:helix-hairpin-helix domain-containing protein [Geobacteraceae bacterium]NTW78520.1 helix-hairpin-helix domain-containing protein [Geobacteraceae bacterium]